MDAVPVQQIETTSGGRIAESQPLDPVARMGQQQGIIGAGFGGVVDPVRQQRKVDRPQRVGEVMQFQVSQQVVGFIA